MFGFRFIKFSPTTYVLEYSGGAVKREGAGLAFFSTGLGSTGWMKSIFAGAQVISSSQLTPRP